MNDSENMHLSRFRQGPIRNTSLSPELLAQIKAAFDVIGKYLGMPLEEFEIGFMRDMHPESEVALWCRITKAWLAYHEDYLANKTLPNEEERKLLGALITISTGVKDVFNLNVPVEVGRRLIRCYEDPAG